MSQVLRHIDTAIERVKYEPVPETIKDVLLLVWDVARFALKSASNLRSFHCESPYFFESVG